MSDFERFDPQPGDAVRASDMHLILDFIRAHMGESEAGDGAESVRDSRGRSHVAVPNRPASYIGTASGTISARSGTTPGTGTLSVLVCDGGNYYDGGTMPVVNDGHGLADQQRCRMMQDTDGNRWAVPVPTAYSCVPSGSIAAATGSPVGASTGSLGGQTVYAMVGGSWAALPGTYAVRNTFAAAFAASKRALIGPTDDPGIFMTIDQSC